jgi:hypothetical protein
MTKHRAIRHDRDLPAKRRRGQGMAGIGQLIIRRRPLDVPKLSIAEAGRAGEARMLDQPVRDRNSGNTFERK